MRHHAICLQPGRIGARLSRTVEDDDRGARSILKRVVHARLPSMRRASETLTPGWPLQEAVCHPSIVDEDWALFVLSLKLNTHHATAERKAILGSQESETLPDESIIAMRE